MAITQYLTDAVISQVVQSGFCATVASLGWWVLLRLMDRSAGRHWHHYRETILPKLQDSPVALAITYAARSLSVAVIWYGCFSAVRTFG